MKRTPINFIIVILLCFGLIFYINFYAKMNGLPWLKIQAHKKIEDYIKTNFKQKVTIKYIKFSMESGDYFAVMSIDDSSLEFEVKLIDDEILDNYYQVFWSKQANEILTEELGFINSENVLVEFYIHKALPTFKGTPTSYIPLDKYTILYDNLPDYKKVKDEIMDYCSIKIEFLNEPEFLSYNEYETLYKILNLIKEQTPTQAIYLNFKHHTDIYLNKYDDLPYINQPEDLEKYFIK